MIVESINLSLPYLEDVGKLLNLVKYRVALFSLLFLYSRHVGTSPARLSPLLGFLKLVVAHKKALGATSGIKASQIRRAIVCRFQEHWLLFGGARVQISEQRWDYLWDHVSISKQCLDCSRNQTWRSRSFWKLF